MTERKKEKKMTLTQIKRDDREGEEICICYFLSPNFKLIFPKNSPFRKWDPLSVWRVWFVFLYHSLLDTVLFSLWKQGRTDKSHINKTTHRAGWGNAKKHEDGLRMQNEGWRREEGSLLRRSRYKRCLLAFSRILTNATDLNIVGLTN